MNTLPFRGSCAATAMLFGKKSCRDSLNFEHPFRRGGLVRCAFAEYLFETPRPVSCHRFLRVLQEHTIVFTLYVFN